ncbi:protein transport protein SEC24 [Nematocida minor]|uniref:protein transport protein SEC24 n=1 Tax=Nematocida minor TaxID=1912983 RepID=UPI00221F357C|nr:protein transport protein SEC24 [Nematocida minor]KAI5191696.1 protein transport protein SEC24 [Nematocida minor]
MHPSIASIGASNPQNTDEIISQIKAQEYTYTRSSFTSAPSKKAELKKTKIPFIISATILPFNEQPVARVESIPRCSHCKAYLNTYSEVIPPGYKWRCSICRSINNASSPLHSYGGSLRVFSPSENTENNKRASNNPILTESIIEFVSPSEKSTPPPASLVFIIECTAESMEKGIFSTVLEQIKETLIYLNDPHERATLSIMLLSSSVELVRMQDESLVIDRVNEIEGSLPMLMETEYTIRIQDVKDSLDRRMQQIQEYAHTAQREPGNALGLALKVLSQITNRRAEAFLFLVTPPSMRPGAVVSLSSKSAYSHINSSSFYDNMAAELTTKNIAINMYVLTSKTVDIPTLMPLIRKTGGYVRYYPAYIGHYTQDKNALKWDLIQHFSLDNGNNAYCRVRVSNEVSIKQYWGVDAQNDGLIRLPRLGRGKTFSFELDYDDDLVLEGLTVQIASIFTNAQGERVVRIINFAVPLGPTAIDVLGVVHSVALKALDAEIQKKGTGVQRALALASDCIECTGLAGTMGVFPSLIHALIKSKIFLNSNASSNSNKGVSPDLRGVICLAIQDAPVKMADAVIYPTLVRLDGNDGAQSADEIVLPSPVRLTGGVVGSDGTYYLDCGVLSYIFVGSNSEYKVFEGVQGRATVTPGSSENEKIRNVMDYMVDGRVADPVTYIVQQDGHAFLLEGMQSMLLDDGPSPVSASYQEYYNRFVSKGYVK